MRICLYPSPRLGGRSMSRVSAARRLSGLPLLDPGWRRFVPAPGTAPCCSLGQPEGRSAFPPKETISRLLALACENLCEVTIRLQRSSAVCLFLVFNFGTKPFKHFSPLSD